MSSGTDASASTTGTTTDHDHGYKLLFAHAEMVRDLLTGFVDEPWVQELQFETLQRVSASYVSDDLRDRGAASSCCPSCCTTAARAGAPPPRWPT